jgi:hypothetical protein
MVGSVGHIGHQLGLELLGIVGLELSPGGYDRLARDTQASDAATAFLISMVAVSTFFRN